MTAIEDPGRQLSYMQQCLASDKKPLGLFLGAGCPMAIKVGDGSDAPLIPDIAGISRIVRDALGQSANCGPLLETIRSHLKVDGRDDANVEAMLSHIRALRVVAGKDQVRGLTAEDLDHLDDEICRIIHQTADRTLPDSGTPYHSIATWVDAIGRHSPVEVFTTNYDLLMEQAFEDLRVPYFDGFAGARRPFFDLRAMEEDRLPPRWARLWKLHGSINWFQVAGKGVFRGDSKDDSGSRRVIHPSHLKYQESRRMPYLAMFDRLRAFLKQPTAALILCGYSFRDEHVNEAIVQGLEGTQTTVAFALLFGSLDEYQQAFSLATKRPNLNVLARDGGVIGGKEAKWPAKEKDSASPESAKWITWAADAQAGEAGTLSAEFVLGDFAILGEFLGELGGGARPTLEEADAK
jgi:hypothetical protein